jgi:hypothetical protein
MPYAVEMFFDRESDAKIREIWRSLKESVPAGLMGAALYAGDKYKEGRNTQSS